MAELEMWVVYAVVGHLGILVPTTPGERMKLAAHFDECEKCQATARHKEATMAHLVSERNADFDPGPEDPCA
jgi:hypothetical protein